MKLELDGVPITKVGRDRLVEELERLAPLLQALAKGRAKYPRGVTLLSVLDEAGELAHAANKGEPEERRRAEALDTAVVAMRYVLGEVDRSQEEKRVEVLERELRALAAAARVVCEHHEAEEQPEDYCERKLLAAVESAEGVLDGE